MKTFTATILLFLSSLLLAQTETNNYFNLPIDSSTGKIAFIKIIASKNRSKPEIYSNVKNWIIETYKSPKEVINVDDKESGVILLNSLFIDEEFKGSMKYKACYYYTLTINIKEEKYKITITDFELLLSFDNSSSPKATLEKSLLYRDDIKKYFEQRKKMADFIKEKTKSLISSIENYKSGF